MQHVTHTSHGRWAEGSEVTETALTLFGLIPPLRIRPGNCGQVVWGQVRPVFKRRVGLPSFDNFN